jgi:hypothetical protein
MRGNGFDQRIQHFANFCRQLQQRLSLLGAYVVELLSDENLRFQF